MFSTGLTVLLHETTSLYIHQHIDRKSIRVPCVHTINNDKNAPNEYQYNTGLFVMDDILRSESHLSLLQHPFSTHRLHATLSFALIALSLDLHTADTNNRPFCSEFSPVN